MSAVGIPVLQGGEDVNEQRDTAVEFVEEVRRSGDTRLASMAIATLSKLEVRK